MTSGLNICIIAHYAYRALIGEGTGYFGGVERQTSILSRWLAGKGHRVSMVTWNEGKTNDEEINCVKVLKLCQQNEGFPGIRFIYPRWTSLNDALKRSEADIYYQNCGEYVTGQVALWCLLKGKKFVYSVAHDADCEKALPLMTKIRERVLYRFGLRHCHRIIVQTKKQQRMMRENFNRDSIMIPMPAPDFGIGFSKPGPPLHGPSHILWVGRICQIKRPDRILDLAKMCPDMHFHIVGPSDETSYSRKVIEEGKKMRNITIHGAVSYEQIYEFYRRKVCLCSTSDTEGFPNIYLEAWSLGLPVVAIFDPDNIIIENKLGVVGDDVASLAKGITELIDFPKMWQEISHNARKYYMENHSIERILPRYEKLFLEMIRN